MGFDDGGCEAITQEEWRRQVYGGGFKAPVGENGELVHVAGDDTRAAAELLAGKTGKDPDYIAWLCHANRRQFLDR